MADIALLALNSGSSSLKFGVFLVKNGEVQAAYRGAMERIGSAEARLWMRSASGEQLYDQSHVAANSVEALRIVAEKLVELKLPQLAAIGHRVVHGGPEIREHQRITPEVERQLEEATHFAPLHIPAALRLIRAARERFPGVQQFACLDTAFHRTLPEAAARFALPQRFWEAGVRRYGFHGLSCESVLYAMGNAAPKRMIVAHLGSGASITAIAGGLSVDTTMGLTPTGGIVMGTRTGDLDPGVLLHILRTTESTAEELEKLLDKESGLLGISGKTSEMQALHQAPGDKRADLAVEMFSRSSMKAIAGMIAVLAGLDMLIFTGGIGEHDAAVRAQICAGLTPFGIALDPASNQKSLPIISTVESRVQVKLIAADEEGQIARHCYRLLGEGK